MIHISKTRWSLALIALSTGILAAVNVGKLPIALPFIRSELQLSLTQAGWLASTFNIMAMTLGVVFGLMARQLGALRACLLGHGLIVAGSVLGAVAGNLGVLFFARFAEGVGFLSIVVSAPSLISANTNLNDRGLLLSSWSAYMPIGVMIASVASPVVINSGSWRGVWWLTAVLVTISALVLAVAYRGQAESTFTTPQTMTSAIKTLREVMRVPAAWLYAATFGLYTIQFWAVYTWLPTYLREERKFDPATIALLAGIFMLVHLPGTLFTGKLLQRGFTRSQLIMFTQAVLLVSAVGIFNGSLPDIARYGLCLLLSSLGGLIPASVLSATVPLARNPAQIAPMQGMFIQGSNLGQFISPLLISAIVSATGSWEYSVFVSVPTALVGIAVGLALWRLDRAA